MKLVQGRMFTRREPDASSVVDSQGGASFGKQMTLVPRFPPLFFRGCGLLPLRRKLLVSLDPVRGKRPCSLRK